jgi:predicted DCC family thiol-disulfide oxidoreductase YuxK
MDYVKEIQKNGKAEFLLFIENGKLFTKSDAVIRISRHLPFPWNLFRFSGILPRGLRDKMYELIARNRYRIFGKAKTCPVLKTEDAQRFL